MRNLTKQRGLRTVKRLLGTVNVTGKSSISECAIGEPTTERSLGNTLANGATERLRMERQKK